MAADCRRYGVGAGFLRICDADGGLEGRRYGVGAMLFTGRFRVRIRNKCGGVCAAKYGGCEDSPLRFSSQPLLMSFTIRQSFAYVRSGASGVIVFLTISWPFLIAKMFQYLSAI